MISEKDPSPAGGRYWVRTSDLFGVNEGSHPVQESDHATEQQRLSDRVGPCRTETANSDASLTHEAIFNDLNAEQANGLACIVDGIDFTTDGRPHVPVGYSATTGSQVFACAEPCASAVGYRPPTGEQLPLATDCGPGCVAPAGGVHTSCPGPLVGRTVESVR